MAAGSLVAFARLVARRNLHQPGARLGQTAVDSAGHRYMLIRETFTDARDHQAGPGAILMVWFRLRSFGLSARVRDAFFWKLNYLTVPFIVGVPGFRRKLWMEDKDDDDFLGIYEFDARELASTYMEYLLKVLALFSKPRTISTHIDDDSAASYLEPPRKPLPWRDRERRTVQ
jgi:hypothetical protein